MAWLLAAPMAAAETWLRIDQPDSALRAQLPPEAIDYGSFVWVPEQALGELSHPRMRGHRINAPFEFSVGGRPVDLAGAHAPVQRPRPDLDERPDFHLLQFRGPVKRAWLDDLRRQGLEPVQAVAPFGVLVWGHARQLPQAGARGLKHLRFAGQLPTAMRRPDPAGVRSADHPWSRAMIYAPDAERILADLVEAGAVPGSRQSIGYPFEVVELLAAPALHETLAGIPGVLTVQQVTQDTGPRGELSNLSVVRPYQPGQTLAPGYADWLDEAGVDGTGVVVAVVDGGIRRSHVDLADRFVDCVPGADTPSSCSSNNDTHATHVAGAIAGTAATGSVDAAGFLRGQGIAPGANLVDQRYVSLLSSSGPGGMRPGGMLTLFAESALSGAVLANNSWGPSSTPQGYDIPSREVDLIVRNALPDATIAHPILPIWSIMNGGGDRSGACAPSSLGAPDEAKNLLAVGSTSLQAGNGSALGNFLNLSPNSAHGPACDGRLLPQLVAPGCHTDSTTAASNSSHGRLCGTSMASPVVTGAAALFVQQYRQDHNGATPSPALIKARLTASARDLAGNRDANNRTLGHRPNRMQGWGRLDLDAVIRPDAPVFMLDQTRVFSATGQAWSARFRPAHPDRPLQVMLAWTDAPGHGLGGDLPAWVNDLDLLVHHEQTIYYGNAFGPDGYSRADGAPDHRNNLEGVILGAHQHDGEPVRIEVLAANLPADGLDPWNPGAPAQDFALVCVNCEQTEDFTVDLAEPLVEACLDDARVATRISVRPVLGFSARVSLSATPLTGLAAELALSRSEDIVPFDSLLQIDYSDAGPGRHEILIEAENEELGRITRLLALDLGVPPAMAVESLGPVIETIAPVFQWSQAEGATAYRFELAEQGDFTAPTLSIETTQTRFAPETWLNPQTTYQWRVTPINRCGDGPSSDAFTLQTSPGPATGIAFVSTPAADGRGGFLEPIVVEIRNSLGERLVDDNQTIVNLEIVPTGGNAVLSGILSVQAQAGQAVFDDLAISAESGGQYAIRARANADERLSLPEFSLAQGQTISFEQPGGLLTRGPVNGLGFVGTVSGISGTSTWASDLRMVVTAPQGTSVSLGGAGTPSEAPWQFDGEQSTEDGRYHSMHPYLFTDNGGPVDDQGYWQIAFRNDFIGAVNMAWRDVEVLLNKPALETISEPFDVRGGFIFKDRFESIDGLP